MDGRVNRQVGRMSGRAGGRSGELAVGGRSSEREGRPAGWWAGGRTSGQASRCFYGRSGKCVGINMKCISGLLMYEQICLKVTGVDRCRRRFDL